MHSHARAPRRAGLVVGFLLCIAGAASGQTQTVGSCPGTSDKPQSKIWYNDGLYWAVLQGSGGSYFYKLDAGGWTQGPRIDPHVNLGADGREDVLWNGQNLFVLVYASTPHLYKFTYNAATQTYPLVSGFPVPLAIAAGSETIVLDQDATGRLWAAYEGGGNVYAAYSTSADHTAWQLPGVILRSGLNDDDVASVIKFGSRVGVFWSDQNRWEFGFRTHLDSDPPGTWTAVEIVRPGVGNSDDHLNLCADHSGRVYAITKDVQNEFAVHRRDTNGSWTTRTNITQGQNGTRPVLMLDASETQLYAAYTCWSCGSPDPILYRTGSASSLSFGSANVLLSESAVLNDVTDMKQVLPAGSFLAIAAGGNTAYSNGWGTPPPGNGFGAPGDPQPPQPPPPPPPAPPGPPVAFEPVAAMRQVLPGIAAAYAFDEALGGDAANALDTAEKGVLGAAGTDSAEPTWVPGVEGTALRFDGINDYVEVAAGPQFDFTAGFTLEAWVRRSTPGSADAIVTKEGSGRNYRLRVTSGDEIEFSWRNTAGSTRTTTGVHRWTDTEWHHVAAVRDPALGEDRIYFDGALDARRTDTTTAAACTDAVRIGVRTTSNKDPLAGDVDLVRLAPTVLYGDNFTPPVHFEPGPEQAYVAVTWSAPASGGTPTGYRIFRATNAEDAVAIGTVDAAARRFADLAPVDGVLVYTVRATSAQGDGLDSSPVSMTYGAGPHAPAAPQQIQARVVRRLEPLQGAAIWPLDEAGGATAADASSNANALVLGADTTGDAAEPAWVTGPSGGALRFDGTNDYARAADAPALRCAGGFTVETWVRPAAIGTYGVLVAKESTSAGRNYRLSLTAAGKLELQWKDTAGTTRTVTGAGALAAGTWQHVAGVFDAAAGESRVYVDGRLAARAPTPGMPGTGAAMLRLGARQSSSLKDFFAGDLDLVRVTGSALYAGDFTPPRAYESKTRSLHAVTWTPAAPGSARLVGSVVERCVAGGAWSPVAGPLPGNSIEVDEVAGAPVCYRVSAVDRLGLSSAPSTGTCVHDRPAPERPVLAKVERAPLRLSAGPNPFNPTTTIRLDLPQAATTGVELFDARGRCVRVLQASAPLGAGRHEWTWNGTDTRGVHCASGVYFVQAHAGGALLRHRLVLIE